MPDVYATIAEADPELQQQLAGVLELRAADPAQQAMLDEYTARLELPDGAAVLEVGCGTGAISRRLTELPGVASVTGIDPSALFVARARELADGLAITFAVGDGRALDLPGEAYDAVVFHTSLCHVPHCELALDEAHRVLRPDGRLAVFDGDYATTTMARNVRDPLQSCADAVLEMLVHDPWLMRRIAPMLDEPASPTSSCTGTLRVGGRHGVLPRAGGSRRGRAGGGGRRRARARGGAEGGGARADGRGRLLRQHRRTSARSRGGPEHGLGRERAGEHAVVA